MTVRAYKDYVIVQNKTVVPPSSEGPWKDLTGVMCHVWMDGSIESLIAQGSTAVSTGKCYLKPLPGLSAKSRIVWNGDIYSVVGDPIRTGQADEIVIKIQRQVKG
jgi:hypothetical protein